MKLNHVMKAMAMTGLLSAAAQAGEVEVLHWWTSGGEAKAVGVLKDMLEEEGHTWSDFAVAGGGGESAMTVLKTRAVSGNPPSAAQIKGLDIQEWGELGFLASMDDVAADNGWNDFLPEVVINTMRYNGEYVAAPVNVHRVNWLWANPDVFEKAGAKVPTNLDEFFEAAEKLQEADIIPLAHGGQAWQDATLFEAIALDVLGSEDYRKAFVEHDLAILGGDKMIEVFTIMKKMKQYIDKDSAGRDWNIATAMVINGEAGMQIMGDWAKGEFAAAGKEAGTDFICVPAFGTDGQFTYNIDSFAFFKLKDEENSKAQQALAKTILTEDFQEVFNLNKGSIPVRTDMDLSKFDTCAQESMVQFKSSAESKDLVPSMAHGMATTSYAQGAIYDVVTNFFNSADADPKEAAASLAKAVKAAG